MFLIKTRHSHINGNPYNTQVFVLRGTVGAVDNQLHYLILLLKLLLLFLLLFVAIIITSIITISIFLIIIITACGSAASCE